MLIQETDPLSVLPSALLVFCVSVLFKPRNSPCTWQNLPSVNAGAAQVPSVQLLGQRAALIVGLLVAVGSFCFLLHKDSFFRAEWKCVCHSAPLKTQTEDPHKQKAISASPAWHLCNTFYNIKVRAILSLLWYCWLPAFQCLLSGLLHWPIAQQHAPAIQLPLPACTILRFTTTSFPVWPQKVLSKALGSLVQCRPTCFFPELSTAPWMHSW